MRENPRNYIETSMIFIFLFFKTGDAHSGPCPFVNMPHLYILLSQWKAELGD